MYREPGKLFDKINDSDILRKHIPKQLELDKFLHKLKHRVLYDYEIPFSVKELAAEYPKSPLYRDVYNYIEKGFLPAEIKGKLARQLRADVEDYVIMDGVLFKFKYSKDSKQDPTLRLVIPERLVSHVLYQYHDTYFITGIDSSLNVKGRTPETISLKKTAQTELKCLGLLCKVIHNKYFMATYFQLSMKVSSPLDIFSPFLSYSMMLHIHTIGWI